MPFKVAIIELSLNAKNLCEYRGSYKHKGFLQEDISISLIFSLSIATSTDDIMQMNVLQIYNH